MPESVSEKAPPSGFQESRAVMALAKLRVRSSSSLCRSHNRLQMPEYQGRHLCCSEPPSQSPKNMIWKDFHFYTMKSSPYML